MSILRSRLLTRSRRDAQASSVAQASQARARLYKASKDDAYMALPDTSTPGTPAVRIRGELGRVNIERA